MSAFRYILLFIPFLCSIAASAAIKPVKVSTAAELQKIFSKRVDSVEVILAPGKYNLKPTAATEATCGNCEDPNTKVNFTYGLKLSGRYIKISGPMDQRAEIITNAGYGIFIADCDFCEIKNITVTGGVRDADGNATDAGIVAKNSKGVIRANVIKNNIGDSARMAELVVGVMGIALRENTDFEIIRNEVIRNSWDGIALYRDAKAFIYKNIVDGVDKATGKTAGGGRGVGIGLTWNAKATVAHNLVKRYWKGIGVFVDADAIVKNNIVEDIIAWGITIWDAGKGVPVGYIINNIIYNTGACGIAVTRTSNDNPAGAVTNNLVVKTGQNPKYDAPDYYCYQCALAIHAAPDKFVIRENIFFNNRRATEDLPDYDVNEEKFLEHMDKNFRNRLLFLDFFKGSEFVQKYLD